VSQPSARSDGWILRNGMWEQVDTTLRRYENLPYVPGITGRWGGRYKPSGTQSTADGASQNTRDEL